MADIDGMDSTDKTCKPHETLRSAFEAFNGSRIRARKLFLTSIAAQLTMSQAVQRAMTVEEIQGYLEGTFSTLLGMRKREVEIGMEEISDRARVAGSSLGALIASAGFRFPFEGGDEENDGLEGGAAGSSFSPAISPADSIQEDKVICLECGKEFKQLTQKHLSLHSLSPKEYRQKHGMRLKTSLMAKSLSAARSEAAKARGVPENLKAFQEKRSQEKGEG